MLIVQHRCEACRKSAVPVDYDEISDGLPHRYLCAQCRAVHEVRLMPDELARLQPSRN